MVVDDRIVIFELEVKSISPINTHEPRSCCDQVGVFADPAEPARTAHALSIIGAVSTQILPSAAGYLQL